MDWQKYNVGTTFFYSGKYDRGMFKNSDDLRTLDDIYHNKWDKEDKHLDEWEAG